MASTALAAPVKTEHVEAELVAERTALVPGKPITVALRLKMAEGWHTYWRNPGDSGLPTTLAWKLPDGVGVGAIQWPAPHALPTGPLVNYGYEGEVLLLTGLTVPRDARRRTTLQVLRRAPTGSCARKSAFPKARISTSRCRWRTAPIRSAVGQRHRRRARGAAHAACRVAASSARSTARDSRADADAAGRRAPTRARCISSRTTKAGSSRPAKQLLTRDARRLTC